MKKHQPSALVKLVLALLFLICLADMPYGYYQLVRMLGMIGFLYLAWQYTHSAPQGWVWLFVGSALLINPLIKIPLGRELWNLIDVLWAVILLYSLLHERTSTSG